ncbi:hypothetical protein DPMN_036770 [Dreissena polymorpha]|uniref:Uncharacterized protein n=1 Tax=Dreissena polymorpha TaxID=45954 RepID=A0A9D4MBC3_DREPO|nr:hypothetical protein DPMN_036770 [Dreissena polymorpha]
MSDERLSEILFYGKLQHVQRFHHGKQKECFKETIKASLIAFAINSDTWEQSAMDRTTLIPSIYKITKVHGANRTTATKKKRQARDTRAADWFVEVSFHCSFVPLIFMWKRVGRNLHSLPTRMLVARNPHHPCQPS